MIEQRIEETQQNTFPDRAAAKHQIACRQTDQKFSDAGRQCIREKKRRTGRQPDSKQVTELPQRRNHQPAQHHFRQDRADDRIDQNIPGDDRRILICENRLGILNALCIRRQRVDRTSDHRKADTQHSLRQSGKIPRHDNAPRQPEKRNQHTDGDTEFQQERHCTHTRDRKLAVRHAGGQKIKRYLKPEHPEQTGNQGFAGHLTDKVHEERRTDYFADVRKGFLLYMRRRGLRDGLACHIACLSGIV